MLRELNRVRAVYRLPAVREDGRMDRGAFGHSRDMARRGYFAHGAWPGRVMAAAGRARGVGEVIGWRVQSSPRSEASAMVHEWLGSTTHRHVLLHGDFSRVGIGRATASRYGRPTALYTVFLLRRRALGARDRGRRADAAEHRARRLAAAAALSLGGGLQDRGLLATFAPAGESMVGELLAERRREAASEDREP